MSYSTDFYEKWVKWFIPDIGEHDLKFVCNQAADIYKWADNEGGCVDNFRIKKHSCSYDTNRYENALASGCCGYVDKEVTNLKTGNTFTIGFNYGH